MIAIPRARLDQLQAIYNREAPHRPHWPRDFYTALSDPLIGRVLAVLADHPSGAGERAAEAAQAAAKVRAPVVPHHWPQVKRHPLTPFLDQKSKAAGEKPDRD